MLIITGLRKKRRLERPLLLIQTVNSFINDTLNIQECDPKYSLSLTNLDVENILSRMLR